MSHILPSFGVAGEGPARTFSASVLPIWVLALGRHPKDRWALQG